MACSESFRPAPLWPTLNISASSKKEHSAFGARCSRCCGCETFWLARYSPRCVNSINSRFDRIMWTKGRFPLRVHKPLRRRYYQMPRVAYCMRRGTNHHAAYFIVLDNHRLSRGSTDRGDDGTMRGNDYWLDQGRGLRLDLEGCSISWLASQSWSRSLQLQRSLSSGTWQAKSSR